jgi:hypothetical protein
MTTIKTAKPAKVSVAWERLARLQESLSQRHSHTPDAIMYLNCRTKHPPTPSHIHQDIS